MPRTRFNPLPLFITAVLPALELRLRRRQDRRHRLSAADPARRALPGRRHSHLGDRCVSPRRLAMSWREVAVFAMLGVANNALYLGLGYTGLKSVSAGLGGLIVSANPVFTAVFAALFLGERLTWRKVAGLLLGIVGVALHRLAPHVGRHRQPARHPLHAGRARLDRRRHHPVQGAGAEGQPLDRQRRAEPRGRHRARAVRVYALPMSATSCRARGSPRAFAFLVLGGSILAYLLWFHLLKVCGATAASAYHFLMPPLGHAVRLAGARRACRAPRSPRHHSGGAWHLSRHAPCRGEFVIRRRQGMTMSITLIGGPTARMP